MSVSSVNSSSSLSSLYDSLFGTSSSSSSSSYSVSDYAMISNGSYRKLMKAYYATEDSSSSSSSSSSTSSDSKVKLLSVKSQAATLNNSLEDLSSKSLYEASGKDEKGNNTYDQEKIASTVKSFVEGYNSYINSASELDSTSLLKKATNMVSATSTYSSMLSEIGITIGENNNLVIDEDKLGSADVSVVSSLFKGSGSYGDRIQTLARDSYKIANSEAYNQSNNSSYTQSGGYSTLGSTNGVLDRYL